MTVKLSDDDRCAIDVVLNQRTSDDSISEQCFGRPTASLQKRIDAVEHIFELIGQMPADEPSSRLVAKTLKHIQRHEHDATIEPHVSKGVVISHPMLHRPLQ